jgi:hypothetical protein
MDDYVRDNAKCPPASAEHDPPPWMAPWEFAVHGVVGISAFVIIAVPAIALDLTQQWLEQRYRVSRAILYGLQGAAYAIFATDLALLAVVLYRSFRRTARLL